MNEKWLKSKKVLLTTTFVLLIIIGIQYFQNIDLKYKLLYLKAVPHIDLLNAQYEFEYESVSEDDDYVVNASGFVVFYDVEQQPKGLRQYYVIDTEFESDLMSNGYRLTRKFTIKEIIVMPHLPPKVIGTEEMTIKNESNGVLVLKDESGNMYTINKQTEEITMQDVTGDKTHLITSSMDYEDFMLDFLKNN